MQKRILSPEESVKFAKSSAAIKESDREDTLFNPSDLLQPSREADKSLDLWTVFNVVLEKLLNRSVPEVAAPSGQIAKSKAIRNITETIRISRELWDLAETNIQTVSNRS
jgi:hypothetical protein